MTVILLGSQRYDPTIAEATQSIGLNGRFAVITAGWQEREPEDDELAEQLGPSLVNLRLHRRADDVFQRDPEFAEAYRARQVRYRMIQDFYRIRLEFLQQSAEVVSHRAAPAEFLEEELEHSVNMIQVLDQHHQDQCDRIRRTFREEWDPAGRPVIREHRARIAELMANCQGLVIAGGHVASIINRLQLFDIAQLWGDRPVLAWSAGAMVLTEHVVLFHDFPPQGTHTPQILDVGLGLVRNLVVFPNPESRLKTDAKDQMAMYARRFHPKRCLTFPRRSWVVYRDGQLQNPHGVSEIHADGQIQELEK